MNEWMVSGYTSQWKTLKYNLPQFFFFNSLCVCIVQTEVGSFGIYCVKIFQYELSRLLCCWWRCFSSSQNKSTPFNFGFPVQYVRSLEVITTILIATTTTKSWPTKNQQFLDHWTIEVTEQTTALTNWRERLLYIENHSLLEQKFRSKSLLKPVPS